MAWSLAGKNASLVGDRGDLLGIARWCVKLSCPDKTVTAGSSRGQPRHDVASWPEASAQSRRTAATAISCPCPLHCFKPLFAFCSQSQRLREMTLTVLVSFSLLALVVTARPIVPNDDSFDSYVPSLLGRWFWAILVQLIASTFFHFHFPVRICALPRCRTQSRPSSCRALSKSPCLPRILHGNAVTRLPFEHVLTIVCSVKKM